MAVWPVLKDGRVDCRIYCRAMDVIQIDKEITLVL